MKFFIEAKEKISKKLVSCLESKTDELNIVNKWGKDTITRLKDYAQSGKMIRGGLVLLGHRIFRETENDALLDIAVAMEFLQSAFLIHDDIMDCDTTRRGMPSLHEQYRILGTQERLIKPSLFGESMAICNGDIAFFLGFDLLSKAKIPPEIRDKITPLTISEIIKVGLAQMDDIYMGHSPATDFQTERVINMYRYKTARYTFSLPLMVGGIIAEVDNKNLQNLEAFGENLGIAFQIKDDELGVFGESEKIGKTVGIDIISGKKTLLYLELIKSCDNDEKSRLSGIFGNGNASPEDIDYLMALLEKYGIRQKMHEKIRSFTDKSLEILRNMEIERGARGIIEELIEYSLMRSK
jgi:geranylgeranyl diphosphate synthase type I